MKRQAEVHPQPDVDRRAQVRPSTVRVGDEHGAAEGVHVRGGPRAVLDQAVQPQEPPFALHSPHELLHQQEVGIFSGAKKNTMMCDEINVQQQTIIDGLSSVPASVILPCWCLRCWCNIIFILLTFRKRTRSRGPMVTRFAPLSNTVLSTLTDQYLRFICVEN